MSNANPSSAPSAPGPAIDDEGDDLATNTDQPVPATTGPHQTPGKPAAQPNTTGPHQGT